MQGPLLRMFKIMARLKLRARGYSAAQADTAISKLGDGTILEWIKKYGPTILEVLKIILPLLLMFIAEPPAGEPQPDLDPDPDDVAAEAPASAPTPAPAG